MSLNRRGLISGAVAEESCHISSLVVHSLPDYMAAAIAAIEVMPDMQVPERDSNGKFVVLLETADESSTLAGISQIEALRGVIAVTLVYHQIDD